jgi:glucose dehydrogenase
VIPKHRLMAAAAVTVAVAVCAAAATHAQRDWAYYGQDAGGGKYSTLDQINTANVATLERAWTVHTGDTGGFFSSSPLVVDNVVYFTSASAIWAVEGHTGKTVWKRAARGTARRGVSYWPGDGRTARRARSENRCVDRRLRRRRRR